MSDEDPERDALDDLLEPYEIGSDTRYLMDSSDLGQQFYRVDMYLSGFSGEAHVELAEEGFLNYHDKGWIDDDDDVVFYADPEEVQFEEERVFLDARTEVVLGKRHSESVPVEFVSGENPFRSYRLFMPTHEAVNQELKSL